MIFLLVAFLALVALVVGGLYLSLRQWSEGNGDYILTLVFSISGAFLVLIIAGIASVGIVSGPPDGCYRVSTTTSVGVVNMGKSVTPIVMSGKTYIPIACP